MLGSLENGKRWSEDAIRQLGRELNVPLDLEWGPPWSSFGKSQRAKRQTALQLILSRGRIRKIVWLDADDLKSAVATADPPAARERIRSQVKAGIAEIARRTSLE